MRGAGLFLLVLGSVAVDAAWQVDLRCPQPPYYRRLAPDGTTIGENDDWDKVGNAKMQKNVKPSIRRNTIEGDASRKLELVAASAGVSRKLEPSEIFSLKMYWEEGFCWQEEYDVHREWCWECKGDCAVDEELWWQKCRPGILNQEFVFLPGSEFSARGRFKTAHHDLCLQLVTTDKYVLKKCSDHPNQLIDGYRDDGVPFELKPKSDYGVCINQHHHPKAGEVVENTLLKTARYWKTNLMELVNIGGSPPPPSGNGEDVYLRNPECRGSNPCGMCEGDCDDDKQCKGDLICFQRQGSTKDDPVPGCKGDAVSGIDYCVSKDGKAANSPQPILATPVPIPATPAPIPSTPVPAVSPGPVTFPSTPVLAPSETSSLPTKFVPAPLADNIPLSRKVRRCSSNDPCARCEGDCNADVDCLPGLKCFQKDGPGDVPGCDGKETSRTDFCILV